MVAIEDSTMAELDGEHSLSQQAPHIVFKVARLNLGNKKTVPVPVGVGGKLERTCMAITIHRVIGSEEGAMQVEAHPASMHGLADPALMLHWFSGSVANIEEHVMRLHCATHAWSLQDWDASLCDCGQNQAAALSALMEVGAYPGIHSTAGNAAKTRHYPQHSR